MMDIVPFLCAPFLNKDIPKYEENLRELKEYLRENRDNSVLRDILARAANGLHSGPPNRSS
jgi:hypothetical protein